MEEEKVVAIELPSLDQIQVIGNNSPPSSDPDRPNSTGNSPETEAAAAHEAESEATCLELSARSYIYYFFV